MTTRAEKVKIEPGTRFGRLTVIEQADPLVYSTPDGKLRTKIRLKCKCDCGNEIVVLKESLRSGHQISCGCAKKDIFKETNDQKVNEFIGKRFGMLLVTGYIPAAKFGTAKCKYICKCDCGNECISQRSNLLQGKSSCGCVNRYSSNAINRFIGNKFGKLTVLEYVRTERKMQGQKDKPVHYFKCRCDCGNEVIKSAPELRVKSHVVSCGCSASESKLNQSRKYIGQTFGDVTIIDTEVYWHNNRQRSAFKLRCKCGTEFVTKQPITTIRRGSVSCGCRTKSAVFVDDNWYEQSRIGISAKVIAVRGPADVDVEFEDGTFKEHVSYSKLQHGLVAHPQLSRPYKNNEFCGYKILREAFSAKGSIYFFTETPEGDTEIYTARQMFKSRKD